MKITVLMSSYNGEKYIREQIESVISQENVDVDLFIRDDGSTDSTLEILNEYDDKGLSYYEGKNVGAAKSFFELIYDCNLGSDYYALCDQDDFWLPCKLSKAIQRLEQKSSKGPALYCSDVQLVDQKLNNLPNKNKFYPLRTVKQSLVSCGGVDVQWFSTEIFC